MNNPYIRAYRNPEAFRFDREAAEHLAEQFDTAATVHHGVVRWNSNGQVPPGEILDFWAFLGKPFDHDKSVSALDSDTVEFLSRYRRRMENHNPTPEELFEMRAAFGPDTKVVNAITGKKYQL